MNTQFRRPALFLFLTTNYRKLLQVNKFLADLFLLALFGVVFTHAKISHNK